MKMKVTNAQSFEEVKETVERWWSALQFERKCNKTNWVHQIVNSSSEEVQEQVRQLISQEIKKVIEKCRQSKDLTDMQNACNAINGCFDNFVHAIDAVRILFFELVSFIDFGLDQCQSQLLLRTNQKISALELLYSLSRILILVLKLKRTQNLGKGKHNVQSNKTGVEDLPDVQAVKKLLSDLTYKIGNFIMMDEILIDTKNNFSMTIILLREILVPDEEKLIQFHKNFIKTIPSSLLEKNYKLNILKFLTCSAIINTWSVNIIDKDSVYIYLKFFISICEKYSSETPVILNTSRTLLLLIRHGSFKEFLDKSDNEKKDEVISMLLTCVFMLLEHPVACVRHSARDFLQLLAANHSLQSVIMESVFKLPTEKRCYFISLGALANEFGSRVLIEKKRDLPQELIAALSDPTIVSHVSLALEFIILKDSLAEKNFSEWCETWIVPLLVSLMNVLPIVAADIDKLLEKAFKKYPKSVIYVTDKWARPSSGEELRYVVTALKISHKQGFRLKNYSSNSPSENEETPSSGNDLGPEKLLISEDLLEHCLHQKDDDIRISAFSLLIEAHKTTKLYSERDFRLILYFLTYNLNNQQPATRQKILGLIQKMLVRFADSRATLLKKNTGKEDEKSKSRLTYDKFLESLVAFCFSNIFVGCNFNRLNTVLNILSFCFEHVRDMSFNPAETNVYWKKFLIALDSSYEENKELAVVLSGKLDLSLIDANEPEAARLLYEKAFNLCTHMEPSDVLTGSYFLQALIKLPSSKEVLTKYFIGENAVDDVRFYCIQILVQKLREQIQLAKLDLMTAATCGPMYGTLFAIRLISKNVTFPGNVGDGNGNYKTVLREWGIILKDLVQMCFDMNALVGCVVNSSSPEGHLPMDFQSDFENLLSLNFSEKCEIKGSEETNGRTYLIQVICESFFQKFNKLELIIESPRCDSYESLRSLKALLKENELLLTKIKLIRSRKAQSGEENKMNIDLKDLLDNLNAVKKNIEKRVETLERTNSVIDWTPTAQVLLLCAWRSIKEASLYLGDLVAKLPIETQIGLGLLTKETIIRIGEELKILLCEIKHRGAFEQAYVGFTQLVNSLWKCSDKSLSNLPGGWLEEITSQLELPPEDQKLKLCSTRRSAGLPFLVQAIICSEIVSVKSAIPTSLHTTIKSLLGIVENGIVENVESKIHALNVLRALFKHARLGEYVASYVSRALIVAIRGSRAATWSERNSSSLLFSSLIIRIFGVARSRDEISKKNRMTSRTFFQRYSELYDFLLSEMDLVCSKENHADGLYPRPSLYLVLLILGRLYPPPTEDPENIDLSEFLPCINMSRRNPTMKIRELGARALVPLIPLDRLVDELSHRFSILSLRDRSENERHGILLQVRELLIQSRETLKDLSKGISTDLHPWIDNTAWMLSSSHEISLVSLSAYVKVLHILFKNFCILRERIKELVLSSARPEFLLTLTAAQQRVIPGIYLFLENFYFLKSDILGHACLSSGEDEKFTELFMFMLNCKVGEVQSIPLRILCFVLREAPDHAADLDEDGNFTGVGADVCDLSIFQSEEKVRRLEEKILSKPQIVKFLVEEVNGGKCEFFNSKVVHRALMTAVGRLVMADVVSVSHSADSGSNCLSVDAAKSHIKSRDKDLSTSALVCYAIYLMEEVAVKSSGEATAESRSALSDILNEFSCSDADVKERLAVAKILNRCHESFFGKNTTSDPVIMSIWMIPFKLIADEDPGVRSVATELVHKMQDHILREIPPGKVIVEMRTLGWPHLPLVSLKAQECLLDSYINILGRENLLLLLVQMVIVALSSLCDLDDPDNYAKDEFGVFEKGNPNPYCEDLSLSDLMCHKLTDLSSTLNLDSFMWETLDDSQAKFISESFHLSDFCPANLMEVVETLTTLVEETPKLKGEFSLARLQVKSLRTALSLRDVV